MTRSGGVHAEHDTGVKDCITRFKTAKLWRGVRAWLQPDRTQDGFKLLQMGQCVLLLGLPSTLDAEARWGRQTDAAAKTISVERRNVVATKQPDVTT